MNFDQGCGGGPELKIPDVYGSLRGIRVWNMTSHDTPWLCGVTFSQRWHDGENIAQCFSTTRIGGTEGPGYHGLHYETNNGAIIPERGYEFGHGCPGVARGNHGCGFFANHGARTPGYRGYVIGVIDMYGDVELGPVGLRSSKARIVALQRPAHSTWRTNELTKTIAQCKAELRHMVIPDSGTSIAEGLRNMIAAAEAQMAMHTRNLERFHAMTRARYPDIPVYPDRQSMMKAWPVPDLEYLVGDDAEQVEGD